MATGHAAVANRQRLRSLQSVHLRLRCLKHQDEDEGVMGPAALDCERAQHSAGAGLRTRTAAVRPQGTTLHLLAFLPALPELSAWLMAGATTTEYSQCTDP